VFKFDYDALLLDLWRGHQRERVSEGEIESKAKRVTEEERQRLREGGIEGEREIESVSFQT